MDITLLIFGPWHFALWFLDSENHTSVQPCLKSSTKGLVPGWLSNMKFCFQETGSLTLVVTGSKPNSSAKAFLKISQH